MIDWISVEDHKPPRDRKILALHCGSILCIWWNEALEVYQLDGWPAAYLTSDDNTTHWAEINEPAKYRCLECKKEINVSDLLNHGNWCKDCRE